jgi:trans-2,3-dihydro-3-hydroxyanthranilate isomerase
MSSDQRDYRVVDVFTDRAYAGNPLAVVLDGDGLTTEQMQSMAREFNLSETTFVLPTTQPDATYCVRIFTPGTELPFAGHPSIGTAWTLAQLGRIRTGDVIQECPAGLMPITVDDDGAVLTGGAPSQSEPLDHAPYLAALRLHDDDFAGSPLRICGCGLDWAFLHVRDEALTRVELDLAALGRLDGTGVSVFSFDKGRTHARCFAAGAGVPEDPATGSAALGLGVYLVASGLLPGDGTSSYEIAQGIEMGRPSRIAGSVLAEGGRATEVKVTGGVSQVATGRITVPA